MPASKGLFNLRAMQPSDSPAVEQLITEFDGELTTRFLVDAYTAITSGTEDPTVGMVVEREGAEGLVGMGTMRFSQAQFNGDVYPLAFLDGLKVHKAYRGQGLGYQIASWRVQQARERYGDQCLIATGMLKDNHASHGVAKKWCSEFIEPAFEVLIMPVRNQAPKALPGVRVCPLEPRQYAEFADSQNRFYSDYQFYQPLDAGRLAKALEVSVQGRKPYRYYVALDASGNLLAGASTWARGLLKSDQINHLPAPFRILDKALHILPADYIIRDIAMSGLWFQPGQLRAACFLWESIRWMARDQGTTLFTSLDPRDPLRQVVSLKPWHQPRPVITLAIHGPGPIQRDKLIFATGRV